MHGSTGWLVPCRDLLQVQLQPDALDRRFSLGLQDYDSTVGTAQPWRGAGPRRHGEGTWRPFSRSRKLRRHGEAGRERVESIFTWRVVSDQYRELWSELGERRASSHTLTAMLSPGPWLMPHACLSLTPALRPHWSLVVGSRKRQRSQPAYRHHADMLSATTDPDPFPGEPGRHTRAPTPKGRAIG